MKEDNYDNKPMAADCCASRALAHQVLRDHADRLRREAGRLHQEADSIEQLAHHATGIQGKAEEALYRLVIDGIMRSAPRAI